jgi:hypothetical protein
MLYLDAPLPTVKLYAIIAVLAVVDNKMLAMISNIETEGSIESVPLEYNNAHTSAWYAITRIVEKYQEGRINFRFSAVVVTIITALQSGLLNFVFICLYFY